MHVQSRQSHCSTHWFKTFLSKFNFEAVPLKQSFHLSVKNLHLLVLLQRDVKTMEESETGINLQELPNDDQGEAKEKEAKKKEERGKQGMLIPSFGKC